MKDLFLKVKENVLSVSGVKYFDWDDGQFDGDNQSPPNVPGVVMDLDLIDYSHGGRGYDPSDMRITIKCAFRLKGRSDSNAPAHQLTSALEFLDILKEIGDNLVGLRTDTTGPLQREQLIPVPASELKVYQYTFSLGYFDTGAVKTQTKVTKPPLDVQQ